MLFKRSEHDEEAESQTKINMDGEEEDFGEEHNSQGRLF